ncbi:hypothetical protein PM082_011290 [Marasmius tenuissimus]|nr:hypothetical protein PM082_011290 [Marasmius tenuissimus]
MVRPRKYKTKAQQGQAILDKSRRNYNKHREKILARMASQRKALKAREDQKLVKSLLGSMHRVSSETELNKHEEKKVKSYFESLLDVYRAELSSTFTSTPLIFYESLYQRTISWLDQGHSGVSPFNRLESQIQKLNTTVTLHLDKIWTLFGDRDLYQQFSSLQDLVREHLSCIDELEYGRLVDGLIDEDQLYEKYKEGKCVYQNPSRVPHLSGTNLVAGS